MYGFVPTANVKPKTYIPTTSKEPNVLAGIGLKGRNNGAASLLSKIHPMSKINPLAPRLRGVNQRIDSLNRGDVTWRWG
jgi:hypothetical protein